MISFIIFIAEFMVRLVLLRAIGAVTALKCYSSGSIEILVYDFTVAKQVNRGREAITYTYECAYWFSRIHCEIDIIVYVRTATAACSLKT